MSDFWRGFFNSKPIPYHRQFCVWMDGAELRGAVIVCALYLAQCAFIIAIWEIVT